MRIHLCGSGCPERSLPSQSRAVRVLPPRPLVAVKNSASSRRRGDPRHLGPDTDSKMAPGARGRALSLARLRPKGARVRSGARARAVGASGPRPRRSAHCPAQLGGFRLQVPRDCCF